MIGVAIRNEKRAESSCLSPATTPAAIVRPEREKPGISARHCATPIASAPFQFNWSRTPTAFAGDLIAEIEHEAVGDEKERRDRRRAEGVAEPLFEGETDDDGRDRRENDGEGKCGGRRASARLDRLSSERPKASQSRQK